LTLVVDRRHIHDTLDIFADAISTQWTPDGLCLSTLPPDLLDGRGAISRSGH